MRGALPVIEIKGVTALKGDVSIGIRLGERNIYQLRVTTLQFIAVLVVTLALLTAVPVVYVLNQRLTGDFNIIVADFASASAEADQVAATVEDSLFTILDQAYVNFALSDVQIARNPISALYTVNDPGNAQTLAGFFNADLVIYGSVQTLGGTYTINPRFWVAEDYRWDISEVTGDNRLPLYIQITSESLPQLITPGSTINQDLRNQTRIVTEFTEALAYLSAGEDHLTNARESIENANNAAVAYAAANGEFLGQEVIPLFASTICRLDGDYEAARVHAEEALALNPIYARAKLAMGNIDFVLAGNYIQNDDDVTALDYLAAALSSYEEALALSASLRADPAFVEEKAHISLGNANYLLYQISAGPEQQRVYAETAIEHYEIVIATSNEERDANLHARLAPLAAEAAFRLGKLYVRQGNYPEARSSFRTALELATSPVFRNQVQEQIAFLDSTATAAP